MENQSAFRTVPMPHQEARSAGNLGALGTVAVWDLAMLRPHPLNPRGPVEDDAGIQELAASIKEKGLLEPLLITPDGVVIVGHRRHRACSIAGVERVRVVVQQMSEQEQLEVMLIENLQREGLDPLQEARGFQALIDRGSRVADIVRRTGLSRVHIDAHLAILSLPTKVQEWIARGRLPRGSASVLLRLPEETRLSWAERTVNAGWSLKQLKKAIDGSGASATAEKSKPVSRPEISRPVVTRIVALESLRRCRQWPLSLQLIERSLDTTSCSCSIEPDAGKHSDLCRNCPLSHFLAALSRETYDATR